MTVVLAVAALVLAVAAGVLIARHDRDATTLVPSAGELALEGVLVAGALACALTAAVSLVLGLFP